MNHTLSAVVAAFAVIIATSWTLHAQTPARAPGTPAEQIADLIKRVTALEKRSTALEEAMALEQASSALEQVPTKTGGTAPTSNRNEPRPTALEQRPSSRVKAPFEVVDDAGKVVFRVAAGPLRVFQLLTATGQIVVTGSEAEDGGGFFRALSTDQSTNVVMGATGKFTGLLAKQGQKNLGAFGFKSDGKAHLDLTNAGGTVVSHLGVGTGGGGVIQLANSGGNAQVEAGVLESGAGLVRTFPNGNPGAGLVGMPGTFIMGRGGK